MDATAPTPGLFSYLKIAPPTGTTPVDNVAKFLRFTGLLLLVSAGLGVLSFLVVVAFSGTMAAAAGPFGAAVGGAVVVFALFGLVIMLAIFGVASWWVSFTYFHWMRRDRRGFGHALGVGIVAIVLGGLGVLTGIGNLGFTGSTGDMLFGMTSLLTLLVDVALLVLGIMVVINRNKPECQAAFGTTPTGGYTPHA